MIVLMILVGCDGGAPVIYKGTKMTDYFPMDGDRTARYYNEDTVNVTWTLLAEKIEPTQTIDGTEVVTFNYSEEENDAIIGTVGQVLWSSRDGKGIKIHGYAEGTGDVVMFDTPIQFADGEEHKGD